MIHYNVKYDDLHAPVAGPVNPLSDGGARGLRNHATGHVETAHIDRFMFEARPLTRPPAHTPTRQLVP